MKKQQKKDRTLGVRREVVRFLGSAPANVAGGACGTTDDTNCQCTQCSGTGCTNSAVISY